MNVHFGTTDMVTTLSGRASALKTFSCVLTMVFNHDLWEFQPYSYNYACTYNTFGGNNYN